MNDLCVYASPLPFSNKQVKMPFPEGSTVQQIIDLICPDRFQMAGIGAVVFISGHEVYPDKWHVVRPKQGTVINVRIVPMGGGGKKNPLASLLSIAVLIAAPYAGATFGPTLGLSILGNGVLTAGQTLFFSSIVSATVGIVGKLLISAIAPPPKPSNYGNAAGNNPTESPTQFIEGAQNSLNPYGVVPICLGTNRMFPLQAARPYTETQNNDQYVRQIFTYGYGQSLLVSDYKIGETDLAEFSDFELEHRLSGDLHLPTGLYSDDVYQNDFNVLLQQVDGFTLRTTQPNVDEAIVDVTFPQGLSEFNNNGNRLSKTVQLEVQFAPTGTTNWSPPIGSYKSFTGATLSVPPTSGLRYRGDLIVVDGYTGVISRVQGTAAVPLFRDVQPPPVPANKIRLSTLVVGPSGILSHTDDRQATPGFGYRFALGDFLVTTTTNSVTVAPGGLIADQLTVTASQTEALRKSVRIVFPANGTYDIRIRRISTDTASDQIFDKVYLTAIKSVTHRAPVRLEGINGTAVRIRATDQLNGALDQFNVIVSNVIPDYDAVTDTWIDRATSNPASLYRYVLQGAANAKPLADSKLDLAALADWHTHCAEQGYSYNRVVDYETSVDAILRDIASAGAASPAIVDGKRTVVIDRLKDDVVQVITPRNSWAYSGEMTYPELPHAFRVQFRNADKGYQQDERIVYDDGYDETNATEFEALELQSCTSSDLAFKTARRHIASARLRPETHTFMLDVENLVALRGDRIKLEHDVPIIGIGDGRIKTVETSGGNVTGFTLDDTVAVPGPGDYYVRIRLGDGTQLYKPLNVTPGAYTSFSFISPFPVADSPAPGDLCAFFEAGGEVDLIITKIEPQDDLTARITAVDYAPAVFTAENSTIPAFESHITTPLEFIRPLPPVLLGVQSDEAVMLKNSDGSYTPRLIITLGNENEGNISPQIKIRKAGTDSFTNGNVLEATPERVILTGLEDGVSYDIHVRYRRSGSSLLSLPLQLNGYVFVGVTGLPDDVTGFVISVSGQTSFFKWDANDDIDLSHYRIKFSSLFTGATWATSQLLEDRVYDNRLSIGFQPGTYLIKAVDGLGNESVNATAIITYNPGMLQNAVETVQEDPVFAGTLDNVAVVDNALVLANTDLITGYYYFDQSVDLTGVFTSFVSASLVANGIFTNDFFAFADLFAESDIIGGVKNDLFAENDLFAMDDVFGIGLDAWSVSLEYRSTLDDPAGTPVWSGWLSFSAGNLEFWAIEFRLKMVSRSTNISPSVTTLSVTVDMPDRIERGEDMIVPATGITITYDTPFKSNPSVVITTQDGDANDEYEFAAKDAGGFTLMVYNTVTTDYVERTFDYIASGYGRKKP